jgi:hypothetical protein
VETLNVLGSSNRLFLKWIPGHAGIEGNERADALAKKASETVIVGPEPFIPVSQEKQKGEIKRSILNQWNDRWNALTSCRQSKMFGIRPTTGVGYKEILSHNRKDIRYLVGIVTGHCVLNRHLFLLKVRGDPRCPNCGAVETAFHFMAECPRYDLKRLGHLGKLKLTEEDLPGLTVRKITSFTKATGRLDG